MSGFNKKISELFGKIDEKMLQKKINTAIDMLQNGDTDELAKKLNKIDRSELLQKINEFDETKLDELNINKNEIKEKISDTDLANLAHLLGEQGDEIVDRLKDFLGKP
ncbi:MAG: membrane trafficking protein [Clostridium sp.]|nr:membrane trafficking protein [Clostridium sp.]